MQQWWRKLRRSEVGGDAAPRRGAHSTRAAWAVDVARQGAFETGWGQSERWGVSCDLCVHRVQVATCLCLAVYVRDCKL